MNPQRRESEHLTQSKNLVAVLALGFFLRVSSAAAAPPAPAAPAPTPAAPPAAAAAASPAPTPDSHATVYLKDGTILKGEVLDSRDGVTRVRTASGDFPVQQSSILRIDFGGAAATPPAPAATPIAAPTPGAIGPATATEKPRKAEIDVGGVFGVKNMSKKDWNGMQTQPGYGLGVTVIPPAWMIGFTATLLYAQGSNLGVTGSTFEFDPGARLFLGSDVFRFDLGAGPAALNATFSAITPSGKVSNSGGGVGYWADGGLTWLIRGRLNMNLGLQARYSAGKASIHPAGVNVEAGGLTYGLVLEAAY